MQGGFGGAPARPKTIVVSDFLLSSDVAVVDRGYHRAAGAQERRLADLRAQAAHRRAGERRDRRQHRRHLARGRARRPARQRGRAHAQRRGLVVSGRLRPGEPGSAAKNKQIGFGAGRGSVVADMTLSYFSSGGKKQLLSFIADAKGAGKPPAGKQAAARNAAIAAALTAEKTASGEVVARRGSAGAPDRPRRRREDRRLCQGAGLAGKAGSAEARAVAAVKLPQPKPEASG